MAGLEAKKKYLESLKEYAAELEDIKKEMPEGFEEAGLEEKLADVKDEIEGLTKDIADAEKKGGRRTRRRRLAKKHTRNNVHRL